MTTPSMLANKGERMVPEISDCGTFWEHLFRYAFAARFADKKAVLDVACGDGYGSWVLKMRGANSVIGIDVNAEACQHAREKYGVDARFGDATRLPIATRSVDLVVSFETIEHLERPADFLDECVRVLRPHGELIISTPNADVYSAGGFCNPFHCSEMDHRAFVSLLRGRFDHVRLYSQSNVWASRWLVRSLVSRRSPWTLTPGYWRLRQFLRGNRWEDLNDRYRRDIGEALRACESLAARWFSPYSVRVARQGFERPTYLVAVVSGPRPTLGCRDA